MWKYQVKLRRRIAWSCTKGTDMPLADSIDYAKVNAQLNSISNARFLAGSAEAIFKVGRLHEFVAVPDL